MDADSTSGLRYSCFIYSLGSFLSYQCIHGVGYQPTTSMQHAIFVKTATSKAFVAEKELFAFGSYYFWVVLLRYKMPHYTCCGWTQQSNRNSQMLNVFDS